jgi:riboflavin kinase / FMN adenylyltransferase
MSGKIVLTGIVVKGNRLGQTIGFPTANLLPGEELPMALHRGVYAVKVKTGEKWYGGMANIGIRPTLGLHELTVEAHLFDFSGDLYGKTITVCFFDYIREEKKFAGLEELTAQLEKDKYLIREKLTHRSDPDTQSQQPPHL